MRTSETQDQSEEMRPILLKSRLIQRNQETNLYKSKSNCNITISKVIHGNQNQSVEIKTTPQISRPIHKLKEEEI